MSKLEIQSLKTLARRMYWRNWVNNNKPYAKAARAKYAASPQGKAAQSKAGAKYYAKKRKEAQNERDKTTDIR